VPESLTSENRRPVDIMKMIPGVSLISLRKYKGVLLLITAFFLANLAGQALPSTWSYYGIERYDWSPWEIGISLMVVGLLVAIAQGFLVGIVVKKIGKKRTVIFGFLLWTIGMFLFSQASEPWMLYAFLIPYAFGGVAGQLIFSSVFYYFIREETTIYFPGASYALAAIILLVAFVYAFIVWINLNVALFLAFLVYNKLL